ncbi:hypothetical protein OsI_13820 [Oryza sativa Indica Group]|uniref:Uncharacterized protein n=1 Tax=Oryza sativa subsp. indica TaxID=39946 RepID=B8AKY8_ORYSI|nr:hypothetical protein OsI_13820 [Oryza sativa Indica Group]
MVRNQISVLVLVLLGDPMPKDVLAFVIPKAGCGVDEFMLAEVNEKTGACEEKAGDDCAPNEKPPPEEADWPNVNMLGGDELEPNGLLKAGDDEAVELVLNILVLAIVKDDPAEEIGDENANPLPGPEKVVPDPNGELPNKDPDEEVVTPKDTVPGPDEVPAPKDTVPGPDEEVPAPAPKDKAPVPDEEAPAPKGRAPVPDEEAPAPNNRAPVPDEEAPNPKDTVLGQDEDAPVPKDVIPEPVEAVPTPKATDPDPDEEAPVFATKIVLVADGWVVLPSTDVLKPAGIGDETGGLVLDGANVVDTVDGAKLTSGLSIGVTFDNFDDDGSEKPLLRLAVVDAADAKWKGAAEGDPMPKDVLAFVIPKAGCGVDEFMLAEVNEKTGACEEKAGDDCAPNEKPPPEEADWPNVNMLGGDELEPNGLLKAGDDEAVELVLNILVLAIVKDDPAEELGDENANPLPGPEKTQFQAQTRFQLQEDTVPGPDEEVPAPAPKDKAPVPDEEAPAPKGRAPVPDEEAPAPNNRAPVPDEEAPNPKDTVLGQDEDAPVPKDVIPEPVEAVPTPKATDPDPDEEAPVLENVKGAVEAEVVEAIPSFEAATVEDENVAMLEKAEEDVTGELEIFEEIGVVLRFDDALLAVSWAVDLASAIASPVPNNKLLAGFATVFVLSDLVAATIEVLEPKLNVGIAGIGDETGGLVLDGANVVDTVDGAKLTSGLSIGVTFDNFDDDGSEKPLLRLAVVDAADAKWKGAAEGNTLSDDLWTSSVLSLSLPPSKLVMSNVVGLVTLET